ncbi:MAG: hypothetical protein UU11_C0013G0003 [Parcubacteria group bacterium GW2011_GWF2_40_69]|uniref:Serine peptidase n=1 Tax=Candidatus Nomurabacteria bacterium GWB1_40_6 TaxID=1801727 RepID=A0A1F6TKJ3_9BACT|nr:MAG: hypothetical protein UT25_C0008G0003 [Parcubacteria group bacterium GW2011_GWC1_39_12]KKR18571.1 MAG: hypothetical protein UT49_C0007G0003 [Parcubacteria group bacterium GW2011_GWF1_39_37]KKR34699.1 MAG: hypothetical protein UT68_C0010G0003 [Parcubacteria group bacterium GW2011_GWC2_40_10]KKR51753.1 MAG: hypothetical protein UT89_C0008G0003 [Parcubacteria group bacterium GW2011_GWE1_40_20]KKR68403.1 MAG: hypothetical protein UU11_C0013G0003 [Parcubacteria group bacterium GW2011_GWF2_40_
MRLYLSSFDIGNQPQQLVSLAGFGKRVALVLNALDNRLEARNKWLDSQTKTLRNLGFIVEELDLRNYFGKEKELQKLLTKIDVVWVNGGNAFILRRAMKQSGFDYIITGLIQKNVVVYAGFSAGVVVLSRDLHGLDITDNPNDVPTEYNKEIEWKGLGIIDFSVAVHYESNHPESHLTDKEIEYYKTNNITYKTLRDGQVIVINGQSIKTFD